MCLFRLNFHDVLDVKRLSLSLTFFIYKDMDIFIGVCIGSIGGEKQDFFLFIHLYRLLDYM